MLNVVVVGQTRTVRDQMNIEEVPKVAKKRMITIITTTTITMTTGTARTNIMVKHTTMIITTTMASMNAAHGNLNRLLQGSIAQTNQLSEHKKTKHDPEFISGTITQTYDQHMQ